VILEAATATAEPEPGFLEGLRSATERHGAVLIFDEIITGMRWFRHCAQSGYGVTPDLSTWGKALGNPFSVSALAAPRFDDLPCGN
jgi:glutamate-1-semialdehyde 2,1-aminomutase